MVRLPSAVHRSAVSEGDSDMCHPHCVSDMAGTIQIIYDPSAGSYRCVGFSAFVRPSRGDCW